jgi:hypothetical protein
MRAHACLGKHGGNLPEREVFLEGDCVERMDSRDRLHERELSRHRIDAAVVSVEPLFQTLTPSERGAQVLPTRRRARFRVATRITRKEEPMLRTSIAIGILCLPFLSACGSALGDTAVGSGLGAGAGAAIGSTMGETKKGAAAGAAAGALGGYVAHEVNKNE